VLSGTLVGNTKSIITRSGARVGDNIFVTGTLGDSAMGLMLLKSRKSVTSGDPPRREVGSQKFKNKNRNLKLKTLNSKDVLALIKKHLMPEPIPLKDTSKITSMIDISDGLLIDLSHICDESKVGAAIYKNKIPVSRELTDTAKILGKDPVKFALKGGEDYALLFTAPPDIKTTAAKIGEIIKKERFIVDGKGRKIKFKPEGYEHFK
jgi:thiamine-monophosphate kinase